MSRTISRILVAGSLFLALSAQTAAARSFAKPPPPRSAPGSVSVVEEPSLPSAPLTTRLLDRDAVRAKLEAARGENLERFRAYYRRGTYPSNVSTPGFANVWRDGSGNYCAAATIIWASGYSALVAQVAEESNGIRLADVTSGALLDWMLTSGLTQEEIALIQRPFRRVSPRPTPEATPELAAIDPELRAAETRRLAALYAQIDAKLAASRDASLALAVDRLMERPELAGSLLAAR